MKRIEGAYNDKVELEVIECDCGYHMGIDGSFVIHNDDAFFDIETKCPSCQKVIPVRDLLEMEPIEVVVEVARSCTALRDIPVLANSLDQARNLAVDAAGDYEFSEKDADYSITEGWYCRND